MLDSGVPSGTERPLVREREHHADVFIRGSAPRCIHARTFDCLYSDRDTTAHTRNGMSQSTHTAHTVCLFLACTSHITHIYMHAHGINNHLMWVESWDTIYYIYGFIIPSASPPDMLHLLHSCPHTKTKSKTRLDRNKGTPERCGPRRATLC